LRVSIKRLEQVSLQYERLDRIAAIDLDEFLGHVAMTLSQKTQTRKAGWQRFAPPSRLPSPIPIQRVA
jgi:hypothetical protein